MFGDNVGTEIGFLFELPVTEFAGKLSFLAAFQSQMAGEVPFVGILFPALVALEDWLDPWTGVGNRHLSQWPRW